MSVCAIALTLYRAARTSASRLPVPFQRVQAASHLITHRVIFPMTVQPKEARQLLLRNDGPSPQAFFSTDLDVAQRHLTNKHLRVEVSPDPGGGRRVVPPVATRVWALPGVWADGREHLSKRAAIPSPPRGASQARGLVESYPTSRCRMPPSKIRRQLSQSRALRGLSRSSGSTCCRARMLQCSATRHAATRRQRERWPRDPTRAAKPGQLQSLFRKGRGIPMMKVSS